MLTDFDNTVKQLLVKRVPLSPDEVEISFECPKREWSAKVLKPTVNLYLFDLRENLELRSEAWIKERRPHGPIGRRRPPVYIDLSYIVTTWARDVADEHHLLWRVMATLMREPVYEDDVLQGALKQVGSPIRTLTAQSDGVLRNPGEFWGALDNDLKPAVTYTATLEVDLEVLIEAPLVLSRVVSLGDLDSGHTMPAVIQIGGEVRTRAGKKGSPPPQPVAGARVTFPQLGISVQSDADGRYRIADVPAGTHHVRVVTASGAVAEADVAVPSGTYDLEV